MGDKMTTDELIDMFDDKARWHGSKGYIEGHTNIKPTIEQVSEYVEYMYEVEVLETQVGPLAKDGWYWTCDISIEDR